VEERNFFTSNVQSVTTLTELFRFPVIINKKSKVNKFILYLIVNTNFTTYVAVVSVDYVSASGSPLGDFRISPLCL
jgi:hypothetical protein